MGRVKQADAAGAIYHMLNRANRRATIFEREADYEAWGAGSWSARGGVAAYRITGVRTVRDYDNNLAEKDRKMGSERGR